MVLSTSFAFFTNITYLQSFIQLVANNKQVAAANSVFTNSNLSIADAMRQTTLTQCFNPAPRPLGTATTTLPDGCYTLVIDGTKYLVNDTANHMIIVPNPPPSVAASVDAQSITPVDLSKKKM